MNIKIVLTTSISEDKQNLERERESRSSRESTLSIERNFLKKIYGLKRRDLKQIKVRTNQ